MTRNQLQFYANQELARANRAREAQAAAELSETYRSNREKEDENKRHNIRSELISIRGQDITHEGNKMKAATDTLNSLSRISSAVIGKF